MALITLNFGLFCHFGQCWPIPAIFGQLFFDIWIHLVVSFHLMSRLSRFINFQIWSFWLKIGVTYANYRALCGTFQKIVWFKLDVEFPEEHFWKKYPKIPKNINFLMEKCVTPVCTRKSKNRLRGQIFRYFDGMGYIFGILGSNPIGLKVSSLSDL